MRWDVDGKMLRQLFIKGQPSGVAHIPMQDQHRLADPAGEEVHLPASDLHDIFTPRMRHNCTPVVRSTFAFLCTNKSCSTAGIMAVLLAPSNLSSYREALRFCLFRVFAYPEALQAAIFQGFLLVHPENLRYDAENRVISMDGVPKSSRPPRSVPRAKATTFARTGQRRIRGHGLQLLEDIGTLIARSHDLQETLEEITEIIANRMNTDVCSLYML